MFIAKQKMLFKVGILQMSESKVNGSDVNSIRDSKEKLSENVT